MASFLSSAFSVTAHNSFLEGLGFRGCLAYQYPLRFAEVVVRLVDETVIEKTNAEPERRQKVSVKKESGNSCFLGLSPSPKLDSAGTFPIVTFPASKVSR